MPRGLNVWLLNWGHSIDNKTNISFRARARRFAPLLKLIQQKTVGRNLKGGSINRFIIIELGTEPFFVNCVRSFYFSLEKCTLKTSRELVQTSTSFCKQTNKQSNRHFKVSYMFDLSSRILELFIGTLTSCFKGYYAEQAEDLLWTERQRYAIIRCLQRRFLKFLSVFIQL